MKIVSKFKDYYDIGLAYGIDPLCVYVRETERVPWQGKVPDKRWGRTGDIKSNPTWFERLLTNEDIQSFISNSPRGLDFALVLFCGKAYVCAPFDADRRYGQPAKHYYDAESLIGAIKDSRNFYDKQLLDDGRFSMFGTNEDRMRLSFGLPEKLTKDFIDSVLVNLGQPILVMYVTGYTSEPYCVVNPELKSMGFASVVDPYTAFQEVSMYLTNFIGIKPNPTVTVSDSVKVAKHGFDSKSFRHPTH